MPHRRLQLPILPIRLVLPVLGGVLLIAAVGASRLTLVRDITALLPDPEDQSSSLIEISRRSTMMRKVAVVLGPTEPDDERLHRAIGAVSDALAELDGVAAVTGRMDTAGMRKATQRLMSSSARVYRPVGEGLDEAAIVTRLTELKRRLASPEALLMQQYLLADPLGLAYPSLRGLQAVGEAMQTTIRQGHLLSSDLRYGLVVVDIGFDPFDVERAQQFAAALEATVDRVMSGEEGEGLEVFALGGVHYAASSSAAIMSDIRRAIVLTFVCVTVVFLFFFARLRLLLAVLLPGAVGVAVGLGVMGALGEPLHALTIGFAATLTGISVDFAIHLFFRALRSDGEDSAARVEEAHRAVLRPVLLGGGTTVAAFVLVSFSNFTGIRQLALFSAISIPTALCATLWGLPAFHRLLLGRDSRRNPLLGRIERLFEGVTRTEQTPLRRVATVAAFSVAIAVTLWSAVSVTFSGDPRQMGHRDELLEDRQQRLAALFPGLTEQALVVAFGADLQQALAHNDRLYDSLVEQGVPPEQIISISPFLPALTTQQQGLEAVKELFGPTGTALRPLFERTGFSTAYYDNILKSLDSQPIEIAGYADTGLAPVIADALISSENRWSVLTRVNGSTDPLLDRLVRITEQLEGCAMASERLLARAALKTLQTELFWMLLIWLSVAIPLLALIQRSVLFALRAALPAVFGVLAAVGLFAALGRPLTPVAAAGITLVMGLGIDYGIFIQSGRSAAGRATPALAVLASSMTTLAAFGVLALASVRAMADLGGIILLGVSAAVLCSVVLIPTLSPPRHQGK